MTATIDTAPDRLGTEPDSGVRDTRERARRLVLRPVVVALVSVLAFGASVLHAPAATAAPEWPLEVLIAHRGGIYPGKTENGMAAIRESVSRGVTWFEVDLRVTKSHTFVVMHDDTVNRTTTSTGKVSALTAAQFRQIRLKDGGSVPTAKTILDYVDANPVHVVLHLRPMSSSPWSRLATGIKSRVIQGKVALMGNRDTINAGKQLLPGVQTVWITSDEYNATAARAFDATCIGQTKATAAGVQAAHNMGREYWSYTPNTPERWTAMVNMGVDKMIVDDVARYLHEDPPPPPPPPPEDPSLSDPPASDPPTSDPPTSESPRVVQDTLADL